MVKVRSSTLIATFVATLAGGGAPGAASAAWLGLNDGDYAVTLHCDTSTEFACPTNLSGSLSITGGQTSAFDFVVNGQIFVGDPDDAVVDGNLVDTESATLTSSPFSFLSLRLITDGQIGPYGTGDKWWVYCHHSTPNTCAPNTTGTWSATRVDSVPEPTPAALLALALGAAAVAGRTRRS